MATKSRSGILGLLLLIIAAVPHVPRAQTDDGIAGSYIAMYTGNASAAARAVERLGGTVVFSHAGAGVLIVESAPSDFAARLRRTSGFSHVIADRWIVHSRPLPEWGWDAQLKAPTGGVTSFSSAPSDAALLPFQWNIFRTQTDKAWEVTEGDPGVTVAILDTGICSHHVDLDGKVDVALSRSFVPAAQEPDETEAPACIGCPPWEDRHGHGTAVASIVSTNNLGMAGVAPNVRLVAVKIANHEDRGSISTLIRGVVYAADAGIDVINVSRSFGEHQIAEFPRGMALLREIMAYAIRKGALVVIGAGNNGVDLDHSGNAFSVLCDATNGMCIGATTISDALATYSNHGVSAVTMVAPGGGLPTDPFPNTLLNTHVIIACSVHATIGTCFPQRYFLDFGTSYAAPMVSGAAALVLSRSPRLKGKPQQVKAALANSADDLGHPGTDNLFSRGRLNTWRAVQ